ncbi:MAG: hypothetical protein IPJ62_09540 [Betaproteobacteria bacterium]|nr:hypothetical protein [Betaproteobacteria bacterium]
MTLAAALALASLVAVATPADAATISIGVQRRGDRIDIEASAQLDADGATAWRVLADYERYVDFIPDLRVSRVSARRGATVIVEQSGDATLWLLRLPLDVTFQITEIAPTRLRSRAIAGASRHWRRLSADADRKRGASRIPGAGGHRLGAVRAARAAGRRAEHRPSIPGAGRRHRAAQRRGRDATPDRRAEPARRLMQSRRGRGENGSVVPGADDL